MAKRFIDTAILKHHFTRSLPGVMKLLWVHLLTDCNYAGMWQVDWEIASVVVGSKIDPAKAEKFFENKVVKIKGGAIWFMPDFIDFQYGKLNEKIAMHKTILSLLKKENLINEDGIIKPLSRGSVTLPEGLQVKEKEKEKEKEKGVQGEKQNFEQMDHPYVQRIKLDYPKLLKMAEPLTNKQAEKLERDVGDAVVYEKLLGLANKREPWKHYDSVNLTVRSWARRDEKQTNSNNGNSTSKSTRKKFNGLSEGSIRKVFNRPPLTFDRGTGSD